MFTNNSIQLLMLQGRVADVDVDVKHRSMIFIGRLQL